jgi:gluconolactonase
MMDDADGTLTGMTPQLTEIADGLGFPEGPVMLPDGGMLVVEIARGCITRIGRDGRKHVLARPGGGPNGAAFGPDGFLYVCNSGGFSWRNDDGRLIPSGQAADYSGGRIERVDIETGKVEAIYTACDGFPLKGPNDIVFDRDGGFYFTDHGKRRPREVDLGGLFYAKTDGSLIREIVQPMIMPNGVGLSPDERTVYVAETRTGHLWGFDIVAPGVLQRGPPHENGGRHLAGPAGYTSFDSLAVERCGNICVASLVLGGINVIAPDGAFVGFVPMPDPICTNICFGGADLRRAYITLSSTGRIVSLPWPREGLRLNFDPCGR